MDDCKIADTLNSNGYSVDWRDIHRPAILKRDNYKCKHCGVAQRSLYTWENNHRIILDDNWLLEKYRSNGFKISRTYLSIMHLCNNKSCINHNHLAAGCQCCHLIQDKHLHLINRLINAANKRKTKVV
jgi:hypothetical protein